MRQPPVREGRAEQAIAQDALRPQTVGGARENSGRPGHADRSSELSARPSAHDLGHVLGAVDSAGRPQTNQRAVIAIVVPPCGHTSPPPPR
eukprot:188180-Prymnesium_polylepis.1